MNPGKYHKLKSNVRGLEFFAQEAAKQNPQDYKMCPKHPGRKYNFKKLDGCAECYEERLTIVNVKGGDR